MSLEHHIDDMQRRMCFLVYGEHWAIAHPVGGEIDIFR